MFNRSCAAQPKKRIDTLDFIHTLYVNDYKKCERRIVGDSIEVVPRNAAVAREEDKCDLM